MLARFGVSEAIRSHAVHKGGAVSQESALRLCCVLRVERGRGSLTWEWVWCGRWSDRWAAATNPRRPTRRPTHHAARTPSYCRARLCPSAAAAAWPPRSSGSACPRVATESTRGCGPQPRRPHPDHHQQQQHHPRPPLLPQLPGANGAARTQTWWRRRTAWLPPRAACFPSACCPWG